MRRRRHVRRQAMDTRPESSASAIQTSEMLSQEMAVLGVIS